jgi:hypothetical protein
MAFDTGQFQKGLQQGTVDLLAEMDLQYKSQWAMILIAESSQSTGTSGENGEIDEGGLALAAGSALAGSAIDNVITKIFVQSITIPSYGVEYERINGNMFPKTAMWPGEVTMSFLDDSYGASRRWINNWLADVYVPYNFELNTAAGISRAFSSAYTVRGKVWRDNQARARKTARLVPDNAASVGGGLAAAYPPFVMKGLRPMGVGEAMWDYSSAEIQRFEATFAVDEIVVPFAI